MQPTYVMAFRKRLKKRGYVDLSILKIKDKPGMYLVSAREPLTFTSVSRECDLKYLCHAFKY